MRDAIIVAAARTLIGRAYKGAFNATPGPSLGALSIAEAVKRAGIEGGEVDDVVWGAVLTQGGQALNIDVVRVDQHLAGRERHEARIDPVPDVRP